MLCAFRLPSSGVGKRLLPTILSSCSDPFKLKPSEGLLYKTIIRPFVPFTSLKMIMPRNERNLFGATMAKLYKLDLPSRASGVQTDLVHLVRQFGFCVPFALIPIKKRTILNSSSEKDRIKFSRYENEYKLPSYLCAREQSFVCRRNYSTPQKSSDSHYSVKGTGLAEEIMHTKINVSNKEASQNNLETHQEGQNKEDTPKGPKPISKWQQRGYLAFAIFLGGGLVVNAVIFALPDRDEEGNYLKDEFSELTFPSQYYLRLKNKIFKTKKDLEEPFSDKLLPDPLPEPYHQPKYTVLLELTGLLVHSNWTHKHGWRFQKRPGVDIFITQIGYPDFELVVYTTENAMTFYPIVDGLDPENKYIMYRLFRDATRYVDGHHTKDLFALNRDLKKVIVVDWNENSVPGNRDNALLLQKWEGDNTDRQLIGLTQLLQAIKQSDVDDVREVLRYYKQYDDPIEAFRENQRKLQETLAAEEKMQKDKQKQAQGGVFSSSLSSFRRFGR